MDFENILKYVYQMQNVRREQFLLPPFDEKSMGEVPPELKQYNVTNRELYDVGKDFDIAPVNLTKTQKELRKKYLYIILTIMNKSRESMKKSLENMIKSPDGQNTGMLNTGMLNEGLLNFDATFNLISRIIKLLIVEIDPPNNKGYIAAIVVLSIILLIMGIICITRYIKNQQN